MLKDITFGQYYEGRSVIHKTDPRVKIILMILFIVFVFLAKNTFALIFAGVSVLAVMLISRVPLRLYLKNIKAILPVLIFTAIINVFYGEGETLIRLWKLTITTRRRLPRAVYGGANHNAYIYKRRAYLHHNAERSDRRYRKPAVAP